LAFWPSPATVEPSLSSAQLTFRQANVLEHPVQHAAEFLGFSWRPNWPLPNRLFKGTSTRCAVCRPLTPALGLSFQVAPNKEMPLFFRENESTSGKWAAVAILSSFGLAVYGLINRGNFEASPSNPFLLPAFALALGLISTVYFYKDPHPENKLTNLSLIRKIIITPILTAFMSGVYLATIGIGVPLAHTQITGVRLAAKSTILEKAAERTGKGCHYRIYLSSKEFNAKTHTCVSKELWTNAKPGDRVIAELRVGALGTYLSNISPE
jgi:hypothetical protein